MMIASILILLLPFTFVQILLYQLGSVKQPTDEHKLWQGDFLIAAALWGGLLVVITESLSLFYAINRTWLAVSWSIVLIVVMLMNRRTGRINLGWIRIKEGFYLKDKLEIGVVLAMVVIATALFLVAVISPSNNVDAMQYHLPRALHWAQNQSLRHYPITRIAQNIRPYWAEAAILHIRVLSGNDRFVNLVQWLSMIASIVGATGIVALFGGDRRTRWLSAVLAISVPIGVLQSATAQNDYVSTFWVICLAYFIVQSMKRSLTRVEFVGLALALGLGMLTKGTFFPYAAPLLAWFLIARLMDVGFKGVIAEGMKIVFVIVLLNGAFWVRNYISYGGIYGNPIPVYFFKSVDQTEYEMVSNQPCDGSDAQGKQARVSTVSRNGCDEIDQVEPNPTRIEPFDTHLALGGYKLSYLEGVPPAFASWATKVAQMIAMNFVTPVYWFNQRYFQVLGLLPGIFPPSFIESLKSIVWNQEDVAGNPVHLLLIILSMIYWMIKGFKGKAKLLVQYSIVAFIGYSLVAFIGHSTVVYSIRYQLAFLLMGIPVFTYALEGIDKRLLQNLLVIGFLLYALPYVFISNMRPVIGMPPWPTRIGSVFRTDPSEILFAIIPEFRDEYEHITHTITEAGCNEVGLWLKSSDLEYPFWWLLEAPQSGIQLRFVNAPTELQRYMKTDYKACAIICTLCQGEGSFQGLPIAGDHGHVQLFLETEP
jgi:hypothetical protein